MPPRESSCQRVELEHPQGSDDRWAPCRILGCWGRNIYLPGDRALKRVLTAQQTLHTAHWTH